MNIDARVEAWVTLHGCGVPTRELATLLRACGSAADALAMAPRERRRLVGENAARAIEQGPSREQQARTLAWLAGPDALLIAWDDADYPASLLETASPPPVLFAVGKRELLGRPALAIVGSRNATPQGLSDAHAFSATLAASGLAIVSGLAQGIDAAAHRGALDAGGSTIAVTGTGPDRVYPATNRDLARRIADAGLLLTEFPPGTPPLKQNFPRRNRVVAGLVRGVLVVEATLSSGSLITARLAGETGREVFALPGSIHSPFSKGCHRLIRDGAKLVETAQDILEELRLPASAPRQPATGGAAVASGAGFPPDSDLGRVLTALGHDPVSPDEIADRSGVSVDQVIAALTILEVSGRVSPAPGGLWQLVVA